MLTKKRPVLGFACFIAPLGALMAMCFPEPSFVGYSLLLPRIIEEIARLKRLPPETVEAAVLENTRRVFRLPDIKNGG